MRATRGSGILVGIQWYTHDGRAKQCMTWLLLVVYVLFIVLDQFKTMLERCPEFLLFLHECHSERIHCTSPEARHTFQSEVV